MNVAKKSYSFSLPTKLVTGWGSLNSLGPEVSPLGKNALIVCGKNAMRKSGILDIVSEGLKKAGLSSLVFDKVEPEPSVDTVNKGATLAKKESCDVVIGLGGGSALDAAKAIAGIANKKEKAETFMAGKKMTSAGLPFVAIPTTSGSGAEVTPNAVLINKKENVKKSFRDEHLFAKLAIIDPELTVELPPELTAYSGMDALCQAIESFVSLGANPLTDSLCRSAIRLIGRSIFRAFRDGKNVQARTDMSYGALLAGIALFNARMGVVHGIAHPVGLRYGLPHGLVCGLLLPYAMEYNLDTIASKYADIAPLLGGKVEDSTEKKIGAKVAIYRVRHFLAELKFPKGLKELGVDEKGFAQIAQESMPSGSLKHNPKKVSEKDVIAILKKAL